MLSSLLAKKRLVVVCVVVFIVILMISFRNQISFKKLFEGFQDDTADNTGDVPTICDGIRLRKENLEKTLETTTIDVLKKNLIKGIEKQDAEYKKHSC